MKWREPFVAWREGSGCPMRKGHWIRRAAAWIAALLLTGAAATADAVELIPGIDAWALEEQPLSVMLTADVAAHMPFDETRCAQLNALLRHMSLSLNYQRLEQEIWSRMAILVDGQEAVSIAQRSGEEHTETQFSSLPGRTFITSDAATALGGDTEIAIFGLDGTEGEWLDAGYALVNAVSEPLSGWEKKSEIKTKIEGMGTAVVKQVYTVPKEDASSLTDTLTSLCPEGRLHTLLSGLQFSGKQSLTLWRDAADAVLRLEYKGRCGLSEDALRNVTLVWRMCRTGEAERDDLTLKSPAVKGTDSNTLTYERALTTDGTKSTLKAKFSYKTVAEKKKTTLSGEASLTGEAAEDGGTLSGEASLKRQLPGEDHAEKYVLSPQVRFLGGAQSPRVEGTVRVRTYRGSDPLEDATIGMTVSVGEFFSWELEQNQIVVDDQDGEALMAEAASAAVTALIRPLVLLPEEDTLYLSAGIGGWQTIVEAAREGRE